MKQYAASPAGKLAVKKASKHYVATLNGKQKTNLARKKYATATLKNSKTEKFIDFSTTNSSVSTVGLKEHFILPATHVKFACDKSIRRDILKGRKKINPTYAKAKSAGMQKFALAKKLSVAIKNEKLSFASYATAGIKKAKFKRKNININAIATKKLALNTFLHREKCVASLKYYCNKIQSFAQEIKSTVELETSVKRKDVALLGLNSHSKHSEPFCKRIAYKNGCHFPFSKVHTDIDVKEGSRNDAFYPCTENCIPVTTEEKIAFSNLIDEAVAVDSTSIRTFLQRFIECSKYKQYDFNTQKDLCPERVYMYPVKTRNHPEQCYIPLEKENPAEFKTCSSYEVLCRKLMIHYKNPRDLMFKICSALKAHKIIADIDASIHLRDIFYLSKLIKVNMGCSSFVGGENSNARSLNSQKIDAMTSHGNPSPLDIFSKDSAEIPIEACVSCNVLCTPSKCRKIDVYRWKSLKYDPKLKLEPNWAFQHLHGFLQEKGLIKSTSEEFDCSQRFGLDHPLKSLHGLKICATCYTALSGNKIPSNSLPNNMFTGTCPDVIRVLNPIEQMFIKQIKCFQMLIKPGPISSKLPSSERISALKGHFINLPLGTAETYKQLSKQSERAADCNKTTPDDYVFCYDKPGKDKVWKHLVDRKKVYDALKWLIDNNQHYANFKLPSSVEEFLPELNDEGHQVSDDGDNDGELKQDKSWIEPITKSQVEKQYGHLTMTSVHKETDTVKDLFKMLEIESAPVASYDARLDLLAFPEIFPYGIGGRKDSRSIKINEATYEKTHVLTADSYKRRNQQYLFFNLQQREHRTMKEGLFTATNSKANQKLTKETFLTAVEKQDTDLLKKVSSVLRKLPSQNEFWRDVKTKVVNMTDQFGPATFWMTFSPGEYEDEDLHKYLVEANKDVPDVENLKTTQLISLDPVLACSYIQAKFDALLKFILSDANPIGKVSHHFVRTEYQTRLMPHFHCLFWIEGAPTIGVDSEDEIMDYIGSNICCKLPHPDEDPEMNRLVERFQKHKCSQYCLRRPKSGKGKARCKFGFPRESHKKPVLHSVVSSIMSRQAGSYKKRLYDVVRTEQEKNINDYNPILLKMWKGNMDCQFIGEDSQCLLEYITKYATKGPRSSITEGLETSHFITNATSEYSTLMSLSLKMMKSRELGSPEARNFLLAEAPYQTDASFQFVNTVYPEKRKRMLKKPHQIKTLPDGSTDLYHGDILSSWYPNRPDSLKDMSLFDFVIKYERVTGKEVERLKNKERLVALKSQSGYMKERRPTKKHPHPVIVYGPSYLDPVSNSEHFYYSHLCLHKPWVCESTLKGDAATYEEEFKNLAKHNQALAASVEKAFARKRVYDKCKAIEEAIEKGEFQDDDNDDDDDPTDDGDTGDVFENVRKQTDIKTEEQLQKNVSSLSPDQSSVYQQWTENVEHCYDHQTNPPRCDCEAFEPLRIFVSGFGGSGKSHLIRTLMGFSYIKSEVRKEPCHFLLGAPTGIASYNISGQTLHSIWSLPVEHNKKAEYKPLLDAKLNNFRANYLHVCGHIIDEVSMMSSPTFQTVNLRMIQVTNKQCLFGNLPVMLLGDLLQLEPVNEKSPFEALTDREMSTFTGKAGGGLPCSIDLWKVFQYAELTTNHRQAGQANSQWKETLAHARVGVLSLEDINYLNERLIDTTGCHTKDEYLKVFVSKFVECEEQGLNPVCLLPKRSMCAEFNKAVMEKKGEKPIQIEAIDTYFCTSNNRQRVEKKMCEMDETETAGFEKEIGIAVNTSVMLRINDKTTPGLVNGARGRVQQIITEPKVKGIVSKIVVKFDDIEEPQTIERKERKIQVFPKCYVYRKMFPLTVSYAMTIHKSQSLSLDCVFADLGKDVFCPGMAYVALSRCRSHKGLHLLNFCPTKVYASGKACVEYSRLQKKADFCCNKSAKVPAQERQWYTNKAEQQAQKVVRDEVRQEQRIARAGNEPGAPSNPKSEVYADDKVKGDKSCKKPQKQHRVKRKLFVDSPCGVPSNEDENKKSRVDLQKSTGDSSVKHKGSAKKANVQQKKKNYSIQKDVKKTAKTKTQSFPDRQQLDILEDWGGVIGEEQEHSLNMEFYNPVDVEWQKMVCTAFGWKYCGPSKKPSARTEYDVHQKRKPKFDYDPEGDGNCFYRTLAHIATGNEENYPDIKKSILDFMFHNIVVLQHIFDEKQRLIREYTRIPYSDNAAHDYIEYHRKDKEWADEGIIGFSACMLKTRMFSYIEFGWITTTIDHEDDEGWNYRPDVWKFRQLLTYPSGQGENLPDTLDAGIYYQCLRNTHFLPCHAGLL